MRLLIYIAEIFRSNRVHLAACVACNAAIAILVNATCSIVCYPSALIFKLQTEAPCNNDKLCELKQHF